MSTKIEAVVATLFALTLLVFPGCQSAGRPIAAQSVDATSEMVAPKPQSADRPAGELPRFAAEGMLMQPEGWEAWVMVGASLGLSYSEGGAAEMAGAGPGMFQNVYMQPWAYQRFLETGEFAEETMFVLAFYEASRDADPALRGFYEGEVVPSIEVHLKQRDLHESGWGFYAFGSETESAEIIPGAAACYACHREKTALDNVFVQFYPPLRPMLRKAGGD